MQSIIVGRNGSGKTSLLRAIAIGLCQQREASALLGALAGDSVRRNKKGNYEPEAVIKLDLIDPEDPARELCTTTTIARDESGQDVIEKSTRPARFPWARVFTGGYGVNRGARHREARSGYNRSDALQSLFSDNTSLLDPEATLRAISLADHEQPHLKLLSETKRQLRKLLLLHTNYPIEVSSQAVLIHGPWGTMPFHALGDGYRGTAGWVLDLLGMALTANRLDEVKTLRGVVLIDEIDEHLHPEWQRKLMGVISSGFPDLQIVGTTHSPMTIVDSQKNQLIACELAYAVARVYQNLAEPTGRTADEILRGEWFGLSSTLDSRSEKLLKKYQRAIEKGKPEAEVAPLRRSLRDRLGRRFDSPLDELAIQIAAEVRDQFRKTESPERRRQIVSETAVRLREKVAKSGYKRSTK